MIETGCTNDLSIWDFYYYNGFINNLLVIKDYNGYGFFPAWGFGMQTLYGNGEGYQAKANFDFGPVSFCEGINLPEYPGCIDESALNYNSLASEDDGTCVYE
jgi:hypothetical protein